MERRRNWSKTWIIHERPSVTFLLSLILWFKDEWVLTTGRIFLASPPLNQFGWAFLSSILREYFDHPSSSLLCPSTCLTALRPRTPWCHNTVNGSTTSAVTSRISWLLKSLWWWCSIYSIVVGVHSLSKIVGGCREGTRWDWIFGDQSEMKREERNMILQSLTMYWQISESW